MCSSDICIRRIFDVSVFFTCYGRGRCQIRESDLRLVSDEYLMFLFSLRVVADGDVRFKNLTYGRLGCRNGRSSENSNLKVRKPLNLEYSLKPVQMVAISWVLYVTGLGFFHVKRHCPQ